MHVGIALADRRQRMLRGQLRPALAHLGLAAMPFMRDAVHARSTCDSRWELQLVHDVVHLGVYGVLPVAFDDALLVSLRDRDGLVSGQERRADPRPFATGGEHC